MTNDRIVVINGSYRDDGITDQAVAVAVRRLQSAGAEVEVFELRNYPIAFCLNCRECCQQPGDKPGHCVLEDGMQLVIEAIENSTACILAAPTNFSSATALFKRFMERLLPYAYWPWEQPYPLFRKANCLPKKAMLISSSAAPAWLGRFMYGSTRQLQMTAKTIGARPVGTLFTGMIASRKQQRLPPSTAEKSARMALKLLQKAA